MYSRFTAFQTVEMAVSEQPIPIQHYLRQPQRVVSALAASSQIETLGDELFRLKMRPLNFMMLTMQPIVDLHVWSECDGTVHVQSTGCEIRGIDYIDQRFKLSLVGRLQPHQSNGATILRGRVNLEVQVDVPPPITFTPKPILEATTNGLLKSVLLTVKQRLMHHLLADYTAWAISTSADPAVPASILPTNSPLA
ncbi:MAG: DUF1997 domain-containing protein [Lyngbya sp. HA4199-MV5]|jgi:hypothetical protein|nr:DUF1997 domain-containing protein [Lyngbya sp. HA4199-MV5]